MEKGFFQRRVIDTYFLERETPFTHRRPLKLKTFYILGALGILGFVVFVLFFGGAPERNDSASAKLDYSVHSNSVGISSATAGSMNASPDRGFHSETSSPFSRMGGGIGRSDSNSQRSRTANQVIRRGESGTDPTGRLPMGYGISVRLVNALWSTNASSPVIAEVTQDALPPGNSGSSIAIPVSTRAIGNATFDDASQRIQIRFHTLVYPEGNEHSIQGLGLMSDGSAGLEGDYHSGEFKRQTGKFLGNFIGGLADGMKERRTEGLSGMPYEAGSLKNGVLNGITLSARDGSKSFSESLSQTKPTMSLNAGQMFIIFLEHEYTP